MPWTMIVLIAATVAAAVGRLTVPTRPFSKFSWALTYEALAHVFVGGLFGAWLATGDILLLLLAVTLTVWEVGCFLLLR